MGDNEVFACHYLVYLFILSVFKAQVAIGNDAHEPIIFVDNGNSADMIIVHHLQRVFYCFASAYGYGVVNHTVFGSFYHRHFVCLCFYRHIFMNNTDTSFASNGNSHSGLCNGIHRCGNEWNVELYMSRKTSL